MAPAVRQTIPIFIRNTFRPELPGTRIHLGGASRFDVKGFATIEGVALAAGLAVLQDRAFVQQSLRTNRESRQLVERTLEELEILLAELES